MATEFWVVDTFSKEPLKGSPSAVIFTDDFENESLLQNIAMELNVPETVFIKNFGSSDFEVTCFCPIEKGMFFGNCLFAAAHVISEQKKNSSSVFNLILGDRIFQASVQEDSSVKIRFSSVKMHKLSLPSVFPSALNGEIIVSAAESKGSLIVEVRSPKKLSNLDPKIGVIGTLEHNSVIITADTHYETDVDYDFCARVFAPKLGVVEAAVTPLAHVKLASYWASRIEQSNLTGFQDSQRSGYLWISYDEEYTYITGNCFTTTKGILFL